MTSCRAVRKQISQAAEQRGRQRPQRHGADGGDRPGAADPGGPQLVGGQPVEGAGDRPVRERPELGEVGQQDQGERPGQPAAVGDEQRDGERGAGQHQREGDQGAPSSGRRDGVRPRRRGHRAAPAIVAAARARPRLRPSASAVRGVSTCAEVRRAPVGRRRRHAQGAGDRRQHQGGQRQRHGEEQVAAQGERPGPAGPPAVPATDCAPCVAAGRVDRSRGPSRASAGATQTAATRTSSSASVTASRKDAGSPPMERSA